MTDIRAALDAMRDDARAWHAACGALDEPLAVVAQLAVTAQDVSVVGSRHGLHDTYNGARDDFETMLRTAVRVFDALGHALTASADEYERQDQAATGTIERLR